MSERNGSGPSSTGTAEIPVVRPGGSTAATATPAATAVQTPVAPEPAAEPAETATDSGPVAHATSPVTVRPAPRMPRRGPLTVMGPWAPVAGAGLGLVLGLV